MSCVLIALTVAAIAVLAGIWLGYVNACRDIERMIDEAPLGVESSGLNREEQ